MSLLADQRSGWIVHRCLSDMPNLVASEETPADTVMAAEEDGGPVISDELRDQLYRVLTMFAPDPKHCAGAKRRETFRRRMAVVTWVCWPALWQGMTAKQAAAELGMDERCFGRHAEVVRAALSARLGRAAD